MAQQPDFRSEKSESVEGKGIARDHLHAYVESLDPSIAEIAFEQPELAFGPAWAKEQSELLGFWLVWHAVGGFEALGRAGWNRATIFRKTRRFRAVFGVHPDEYSCDWIDLDLVHLWASKVFGMLGLDDELRRAPTKDEVRFLRPDWDKG